MKNLIIVGLMGLSLAGCGGISRSVAHLTGSSKICVDGVSYVQFTSGASVQYDRAGDVVTCN